MFVGRFSGLLREASIIFYFGATFRSDLAVLILSFPDLLQGIIIGSSLSAVLVPSFSKEQESGGIKGVYSLLAQSITATVLYSLAISIALFLAASDVASVLAPGFSQGQLEQLELALKITILQVPFTALAGVLNTWLQYNKSFLVVSSTTTIVNLGAIVGIAAVAAFGLGIPYLAYFLIGTSIFRLLVLSVCSLRFVARDHLKEVIALEVFKSMPGFVRTYFSRFMKSVGSEFLFLVFPLLVRSYASLGSKGDLTIVNMAMKIVELPISIIGTVATVVLLPNVSKDYSVQQESNDPTDFKFICVANWLCLASIFAMFAIQLVPLARISWFSSLEISGGLADIVMISAIWIWSVVPRIWIYALSTYSQARFDLNLPLLISGVTITLKALAGYVAMTVSGPALMVGSFVASDYLAGITMVFVFCRKWDSIGHAYAFFSNCLKTSVFWFLLGVTVLMLGTIGFSWQILLTFCTISMIFLVFWGINRELNS